MGNDPTQADEAFEDEYGEFAEARLLVDLLRRMGERAEQLAEMQNDLRAIRKAVVRWFVEVYGGTLREASAALGIPKSTLHRWSTEEGWNAW